MIPHEVLIQRIFETFFKGVEYVIEPELSLKYLYNIKLTNIKRAFYGQHSFLPEFEFNGTNNIYSEDDFAITLRHFAPNIGGYILVYAFINNRDRVIVTPDQIRIENYGIVSRIKDPYKNRFEKTWGSLE